MTTAFEEPTAHGDDSLEETEVLEEMTAEPLPFLRIVADYPIDHDNKDTSRPMRVSVELNLGDLDEAEEPSPDIHEVPSAGFIRLVTETVSALRGTPDRGQSITVDFSGAKVGEAELAAMTARAEVLDQYGRRPTHHGLVVAKVFGRTIHSPHCDGTCELADADTAADGPAGEPATEPEPAAVADSLGHEGSDRWTGGDRKDEH